MKEHFIRLLDYDRDANRQLLKALLDAGSPEKATQLMAHILASQRVWLSRCQKLPAPTHPLWPDWKAEQLEERITQNHKDWITYLNNLSADQFDAYISYATLKGDPHDDRLSDALTHVINHGTHHRAQVGQQLKLTGVEQLPVTDYIVYCWNNEKK
jgi:uncharacterized damage-inducible protein DinB